MHLRKSVGSLRAKIKREINCLYGRTWQLRSMSQIEGAKRAVSYLRDHQDKLLFVTGSGRSGTQLISTLLDKTEIAKVYHEPNFREDVATMDILRRDQSQAERYWYKYRSLEVYKRWVSEPTKPIYGEVNGTIRYQVPAIKKIFPKAKLMLMVRDGRGVVRSIMGWPQFYNRGSKGAYALSPLPGDIYQQEWYKMSRFEKICWSWRETNDFLMRHIPESHWLQLELITSDFEYFTSHFSDNLNIKISHEIWDSVVNTKSRNSTKTYDFPVWGDWSRKQKIIFKEICGETMARLGYEV